MPSSWTRSPVGQKHEKVLSTDVSIAVEVRWPAGVGSPAAREQPTEPHRSVATATVEIERIKTAGSPTGACRPVGLRRLPAITRVVYSDLIPN